MRRLVIFTVLAGFILSLSGCYTLVVNSPKGKTVYLVNDSELANYELSKKAIFIVGGLVPLLNNTTAPILEPEDVKGIYIKYQMSFIDGILNWVISAAVGAIIPGAGSLIAPQFKTVTIYVVK